MRESKESPRLKAFCRVAPSVLFNDRAIFPAGVLFRASAFNVRTCSDVHAPPFSISLSHYFSFRSKRSLVAARMIKEKINLRIGPGHIVMARTDKSSMSRGADRRQLWSGLP